MVRLPYLCKKIYAGEPFKYYTNWEKADGAWVDRYDLSGGMVLGLHVDSIPITLFKGDDGLIQGFVKFESTSQPLDVSNCPEGSYILTSPYIAYVRCRVKEIVHNVGGDPTDSRAIIQLDGPVGLMNYNYPIGDPLLLLYALSQKASLGLTPLQVLDMANKACMDKMQLGMEYLPLVPLAAAVPLQSTINCYGPWAAKVGGNVGLDFSTAGKTDYKRDTSFAPWQFGSITRMNYAGDVRVATQLSDKYVMERGSVEIADAPSVSLGDALFSGGPQVSNVNVNFAPGTGAVTGSDLIG
jgi:hypothetical protein